MLDSFFRIFANLSPTPASIANALNKRNTPPIKYNELTVIITAVKASAPGSFRSPRLKKGVKKREGGERTRQQTKKILLEVKTITKSPGNGFAESVKSCNLHKKGRILWF